MSSGGKRASGGAVRRFGWRFISDAKATSLGISLLQHPYSPLAFRSLHSAMIRAAFSAWRQVKIPKKRSLIGTDSGSICKSHGQIGRRGTGVAPVDPSPGQDKDSASIAAL
jgi:hypothetical protein